MLQHTLGRKNLSREPWVTPLAICVSAILVGVIAGHGLWMFLPLVAVIPLFWRWPVEMALGLVALLLPFEGISVVGSGQRGLMSIAFVVSIWVIFAVGLISGRLRRPSSTAFVCGAFITWVAASILWAVRPDVALDHISTVVALFLFFLVASSFRPTQQEFNWIIALTVVGGVAAALYSLNEYRAGISFVTRDAVRATLSVGENYVNPNRFAVRLLLPLSFSIAGFLSANNRRLKLIALGCAGVISLALLLVQSRGTLVAAGVIVLVFCVRMKVRRGLIVILLLVAALTAATPEVLSRFESNDRGAGRFDIWLVGWAAMQHYAVAGAGLANFPVVYNDYAGAGHQLYMKDENDSHNIYLEVGVEMGVIGLLLLLWTVRKQFSVLSNCRKRLEKSSAVLVACEAGFCSLLVAGMFGNILWDKVFWMSWVLLVFAVSLEKTAPTKANARVSTQEAF